MTVLQPAGGHVFFDSPNLVIRLEHNRRIIHEIKASGLSGEITIGRKEDCNWSIPPTDKLASGRHAILSRQGRDIWIRDLESKNGTYVNGRKVAKKKLRQKDHVTIGDCVLTIEADHSTAMVRTPSFIVCHSGKTRKERRDVLPPSFTIGSDPTCSFFIADMLVSRKHAEISVKEDGSCWIRDLGSKNGTTVNAVPLVDDKERLLKDGDRICAAHVEFTFYDGAMKHSDSKVWISVGIMALTLVLASAGYWSYRRMAPPAERFIEDARKSAEAEQFGQAADLLAKAVGSRNYANREMEAVELKRSIALWAKTLDSWTRARKSLQDGDWTEASRRLGLLQGSPREAWMWNADAVKEKDASLHAKAMLDAMLKGSTLVARDDVRSENLKASLVEISELLDSRPGNGAAYLEKISDGMKTTRSSLEKCIAELKSLDTAISELKGQAPPFAGILEAMAVHAKDGSALVRKKVELLQRPVQELSASYERLKKCADSARDMDFAAAQGLDLKLPPADVCAVDSNVSFARANIETMHSNLVQRVNQLAFLQREIDKRSKDTGVAVQLAQWSDAAVMKKVFSVDSLDGSTPRRTRTQPAGEYDRMLCMEEFYNLLFSLPDSGDASAQEWPVPSALTGTRELCDRINKFVEYLKEPENQWLVGGRMASALARYQALLAERDAIVQRMIQRVESDAGRAGIIAGGIAVRLARDPATPLKDGTPLNKAVAGRFKELRNRMMQLAGEYDQAQPDRQIQIRGLILSAGIPGDPAVTRMWASKPAQVSR